MKIQHTNISKHGNDSYTVDILIADDLQPDEGQEKIQFVCHLDIKTNERHSVQAVQKEALDYVLAELTQQKAAVQSVLSQP